MSAQTECQHHPDALGATLFHSVAHPHLLEGSWPGAVAEVYACEDDPFMAEGDLEAAVDWQATHKSLTVRLRPGTAHLFTDASTPGYNAEATSAMLNRVLAAVDQRRQRSLFSSPRTGPLVDASPPFGLELSHGPRSLHVFRDADLPEDLGLLAPPDFADGAADWGSRGTRSRSGSVAPAHGRPTAGGAAVLAPNGGA